MRVAPHTLGVAVAITALACDGGAPAAARYRLQNSGSHWDVSQGDRVFDDVHERYTAYFAVVLDPSDTREPDLRSLRADIEQRPVDRHNYDALNALAIGYFELNYRAESAPGGPTYFADSLRAAKLLAVPWRAYSEIEDGALRDAILDFFEDAGAGEKLGSGSTAPRLARIVASLEAKESDPARQQRIRRLAARHAAPPPSEPG